MRRNKIEKMRGGSDLMLKEEKNDMGHCSSSPPKASQFPYIRLESPYSRSWVCFFWCLVVLYLEINKLWEIIHGN